MSFSFVFVFVFVFSFFIGSNPLRAIYTINRRNRTRSVGGALKAPVPAAWSGWACIDQFSYIYQRSLRFGPSAAPLVLAGCSGAGPPLDPTHASLGTARRLVHPGSWKTNWENVFGEEMMVVWMCRGRSIGFRLMERGH